MYFKQDICVHRVQLYSERLQRVLEGTSLGEGAHAACEHASRSVDLTTSRVIQSGWRGNGGERNEGYELQGEGHISSKTSINADCRSHAVLITELT